MGINIERTSTTNAIPAESNLTLCERDIIFARLAMNEKTGKDLALEGTPALGDDSFTLGKLLLGYTRRFRPVADLLPGVGGDLSLSLLPNALRPYYGE